MMGEKGKGNEVEKGGAKKGETENIGHDEH